MGSGKVIVHRLPFIEDADWRRINLIKHTAAGRAAARNESAICKWLTENVSEIDPPAELFLPRGKEWKLTYTAGKLVVDITRPLPPEKITEFVLRFS